MFRMLFKIGIGGCGCQLERTFVEEARTLQKEKSKDGEILLEEERSKSPLLSYDIIIKDSLEVNRALLEGMRVDSASRRGKHPGDVFLYNRGIDKSRRLIEEKFGRVLLVSDGFSHHPELQLLPLSIKEVREEVAGNIRTEAESTRKAAERGYFFLVGLGGGTGTGVISPLAERYGRGKLAQFVLGVLGGREDEKYIGKEVQQSWFRRCFNMLLGLNDLLSTEGLDGVILVDNEKVIERLKDLEKEVNAEEIDEEIIRAIFPAFGETACDQVDWSGIRVSIRGEDKKPPIFVPCYASGEKKDAAELIEEAIVDGKLAECNHKRANKVFIFTRTIVNESNIREKVSELFGDKKKLKIIKKAEEKGVVKDLEDHDIIVLESEEKKIDRDEVLILLRNPGIKSALADRLENAKNFVALLDRLVGLIEEVRKVSSLKREDRIIESLDAGRVPEELKEVFANETLNNHGIEVIQESGKWLLGVGTETYLIREEDGDLGVYSRRSKEIAEKIIKDIRDGKGAYSQITELLTQIPKDDIMVDVESEKIKEIFKEAKIFLFPEEVTEEKIEDTYEHITEIVRNLMEEVNNAIRELNKDNWPIFKKLIFSPEARYPSEDIMQQLKTMDERVGELEARDWKTTETGIDHYVEPGREPEIAKENGRFEKPEKLEGKVDSTEDFDSILNNGLKELKEKMEFLSTHDETSDAGEKRTFFKRLKEMLKIKSREVSKSITLGDTISKKAEGLKEKELGEYDFGKRYIEEDIV
jgi:hypothetical protein